MYLKIKKNTHNGGHKATNTQTVQKIKANKNEIK